jgi:hypothetical protein
MVHQTRGQLDDTRSAGGDVDRHRLEIRGQPPASRMVDAALGMGDGETGHTTAQSLPPAAVAPVVAFLAHPECKLSGEILTAAGGRVTRMVFSETRGYRDDHLTPESVEAHLDDIFDQTDARVLRSNDDRWQG